MPRATDSDGVWPGAAAAVAQVLAAGVDDLSESSDDEGGDKASKEGTREHPQGNLAIHVDVALDLCLGTWYELLQ